MKKYTTTSRSFKKKHKLNKINRKHTATSFHSDYNVTVYNYILARCLSILTLQIPSFMYLKNKLVINERLLYKLLFTEYLLMMYMCDIVYIKSPFLKIHD